MFTFVVTCYNQAHVVRYALESIRYQIRQYGAGQEFQLVVTDDGSGDNSPEVIRQWISRNRGLFVNVQKLFRKENAGICRNYADALRHVQGDRFVVLNGDDLLAPYDLFETVGLLDEYDLICTAFLKFTGAGDMMRSYRTYLEVVLQKFITGKILCTAIKLGCPVMGTAVYRKELLTEEVFDFILQFRTVNDRACFQKIVDRNPDLKVCYVNRPMILYRISENSVSNFNSPNRVLHNREVAGLCRAERETAAAGFFRAALWMQEKSAAVRAHSNYFARLLRFFSPYYVIMLWLCLAHYGEIVRMERRLVDLHWLDCRDHYKRIQIHIRKEMQQQKKKEEVEKKKIGLRGEPRRPL